MSEFTIVMPKLGESIIEATIIRWLKKEGDMVQEDDPIAEIATDKVDSEIPSPVEGRLIKLLFNESDVVAVGKPIAIIQTDAPAATEAPIKTISEEKPTKQDESPAIQHISKEESTLSETTRFYSPLVKSIARQENIGPKELEAIPGTGKDGRLTRDDLLEYLKNRSKAPASQPVISSPPSPSVTASSGDTIVEMDRMRKLIADHMVMSKQVSPHVTSFIEADVTPIVNWRNTIKDKLLQKENLKLTFTPVFVEAAAQALREFPGVNASVDGNKIILKKDINIGIATALPSGNLIVPVIKQADQKNLRGLAIQLNDLADRARNNKLLPDEIQGGTFTITNLGSFGSLSGTPIINQPQVAILGLGVIQKKPVVLETPQGDVIAIRHIIMLSLSYDHRIVDGAMGGLFLKRLKEILENFNPLREL